MASSLTAFLTANAKPIDHRQKVTVSKRLCGEDGKPLQFEIKAITAAEFQKLQKEHTTVRSTKRGVQSTLDTQSFNNALIFASLVDPDFHDRKFQEAFGVMTPDELLGVLLEPGEYTDLLSAVSELNGFDPEEMVAEAKN